jgi:hypothetical protein
MKRSQHQTHQLAAIHELAVPISKPRLDQCAHSAEWWQLRGASLSLTRTYRESITLRFVLLQERIERESRALDRQCSDLMSDAALVGNDVAALRRLSIRVAIFCQQVDALEETVESLLREREADLKAG